jgi:hypothetical protein
MWGELRVLSPFKLSRPASMWGGLTSHREANPPRVDPRRSGPLPQCPQFKAFARYAALKSGVSLRRQPFSPVRLSTSPASSR